MLLISAVAFFKAVSIALELFSTCLPSRKILIVFLTLLAIKFYFYG
jgi:hypothetical protein